MEWGEGGSNSSKPIEQSEEKYGVAFILMWIYALFFILGSRLKRCCILYIFKSIYSEPSHRLKTKLILWISKDKNSKKKRVICYLNDAYTLNISVHNTRRKTFLLLYIKHLILKNNNNFSFTVILLIGETVYKFKLLRLSFYSNFIIYLNII